MATHFRNITASTVTRIGKRAALDTRVLLCTQCTKFQYSNRPIGPNTGTLCFSTNTGALWSRAENSFLKWCVNETTKMKQEGTYEPPQSATMANIKAPYIMFADFPRRILNFTSYDYLGLAVSCLISLLCIRNKC